MPADNPFGRFSQRLDYLTPLPFHRRNRQKLLMPYWHNALPNQDCGNGNSRTYHYICLPAGMTCHRKKLIKEEIMIIKKIITKQIKMDYKIKNYFIQYELKN